LSASYRRLSPTVAIGAAAIMTGAVHVVSAALPAACWSPPTGSPRVKELNFIPAAGNIAERRRHAVDSLVLDAESHAAIYAKIHRQIDPIPVSQNSEDRA
jgi:hypothetical protein